MRKVKTMRREVRTLSHGAGLSDTDTSFDPDLYYDPDGSIEVGVQEFYELKKTAHMPVLQRHATQLVAKMDAALSLDSSPKNDQMTDSLSQGVLDEARLRMMRDRQEIVPWAE